MSIRKNIDYTAMYARIGDAMQADLRQMERYFAIGQAVAERPEKGAAVAAAEYIQGNRPDVKGYSPRNMRRIRELYRGYGDCPETIALAEQIGWTQNIVILEADLDMRAVRQFGWSKQEPLEMISNAAHTEIVLDNDNHEGCGDATNEYTNEIINPITKNVKNIRSKDRAGDI